MERSDIRDPAFRHSASLRAFTPVFDGLWTRINALMAQCGLQSLSGLRPCHGNLGPRFRGEERTLCRRAHTSSGHGTMVDLTVFIAIASLTARETPSSSKG
jgi:hypothetical protein